MDEGRHEGGLISEQPTIACCLMPTSGSIPNQHLRVCSPGVVLLAVAASSFLFYGCSRTKYRRAADQEAACLIAEKGGDARDRVIYADPYSRLADPASVDCPPIPPDDPQSHALMHCVDGKSGFDGWHRFGDAPQVESTLWQQSLISDDEGEVVVDLREAVRLSRLHSRDYQTNLETLYVSALNVSFERFRFDHQFFAGSDVFTEFQGRDVGQRSRLGVLPFANGGNRTSVQKLTATGGEVVVGFANSLLWDFWGNDSDLFSSAIDFSIVQPLLRFGGRARVLESLTQSERNLLANVRQWQQFQSGFYVDIVTGRNGGPGPTTNIVVGGDGLGIIAGTPSGRSGAPSAGGYLGLLEDQQEIRNRASNIAALRDSLAQLEAAFDANRISSRLQVDQARQALLNAQSGLLIARAAYQSRLDGFKVDLGLPPDLAIKIQDPLLDRFILIDPKLTELQNSVEHVLSTLRVMRDTPETPKLESVDAAISKLSELVEEQLHTALAEMKKLDGIVPQRREQLLRVKEQIETLDADVDPRVYDVPAMEARIADLQIRIPEIASRLEILFGAVKKTPERRAEIEMLKVDWEDTKIKEASEEKRYWYTSLGLATALSDTLLELSLVQAEVRLQGISLKPTDMDAPEALEYARLNRLDWMNARANLVDVYRQIEFRANALKSDLDVVVQGQLGTEPDNIFEFDGDRSRVRFGVRFDSPLTRLDERNDYRIALLNYQRARRRYMLFEDRISQSLRNTLRTLTLSEINLEVRRAAVQVAIAQVDIARLKLNPPVRPNQPSRTSPTAARDLVSALSDLLDAQNDFLNVWVANEVLRVLLDFEMGTMELDPTGVWIDSGMAGETASPAEEPLPVDFSNLLNDPQNQFEITTVSSDSVRQEP